MPENELASIVVDAAYQIHCKLGPGLFESVYHAVLVHELQESGLHIESEVPIPVVWNDVHLEVGFKADIMVEQKIILELKSVEQISGVHKKQLLTYLRLTECRLGLLLNFGTELIKDGIFRIVNGLPDS